MRTLLYSRVAVAMVLVAGAGSACSSSGSKSSSGQSTKAAFCSAEVTINKAGANASSAQDFLAVLKANGPAIAALGKNAPSGKIGTEAQALVKAADTAVASNNTDSLQNVPQSYSGDIDTYCGVDGNGDPLPAYFAQGKGTQFCAAETQIDAGTSQAQSADDVLNFLKAHQGLVSQVAANTSNLPGNLEPEVHTLVSSAQQAIATNSSDPLNSQDVQNAASDASLYCGENQ